jgi:hypothetical protein
MKRILVILLLGLTGPAWSQIVDIAGTSADSSRRESLRVPTNGVISILLSSGQRALIQFTKIHESAAEYRWKYRPSSGGDTQVGTGMVTEKYEEMAPRDGDGHEVLPLPGHDVIVRAGEIRAEYSAAAPGYCYFYFNPKRAKVVLGNAEDFAKGP